MTLVSATQATTCPGWSAARVSTSPTSASLWKNRGRAVPRGPWRCDAFDETAQSDVSAGAMSALGPCTRTLTAASRPPDARITCGSCPWTASGGWCGLCSAGGAACRMAGEQARPTDPVPRLAHHGRHAEGCQPWAVCAIASQSAGKTFQSDGDVNDGIKKCS